jgi:predicted PurR-regulated permease PerM
VAEDGPLARPFAVGVGLIVAYGVLRGLASVAPYLLVGFFGIVVATVFSYPVALLGRVMPRSLAVLLTLFLFAGTMVAVGWLTAPTLARQIDQLSEQLPQAVSKLERWWSHQRESGPIAQLPNPRKVEKQVVAGAAEKVGEMLKAAPALALTVAEGATGLVLVLALGFFLVFEPREYLESVGALIPRRRRPQVVETLHLMGTTLRRWTGGIFLSMALMGSLTALGLYVIGIDAWLPLGLITFFGTFVPYAGALLSAVPGLAVALAQSPGKFMWALLVYVGVHLVEGYLVEPLIMKRAVELRPAVLLMWQLAMGALFGPIGVVVATPLLACVKVAVQHLWIARPELV